jgi:aspartate-semialdehyde dehydrogenase
MLVTEVREKIKRTERDNWKLRVGILGATGTVGQRFIQLLEDHPEFEVTALAASDRSEGKLYKDACTWRLNGEMPERVKSLRVALPQLPLDCDLVFSSLPADVAGVAEDDFACAGYPVISNSSAHRMKEDVPLLIPEVNYDHLALLDVQRKQARYDSGGFIVTNPNCSTIVLALALAPLHERFTVVSVIATTLQAISGAGYPGVASLDITDNVLPFIQNEEEKIEQETRKILGNLKPGRIDDAQILTSAQCHRVNVVDGHLVAVRVKFARSVQIEELREAFESFTSLPQELRLHSAPDRPIIVRDELDRPQPRLDRDAGNGMSITVGRIATDRVLDYRFVALGHNTIRGAAGAAILNAELLAARGYLSSHR